MEMIVASVVALSTASLLGVRSWRHRPRWVSPYSVEREAFQRVTRTRPTEFAGSNGVHLVAVPDLEAEVVSLADHRHRSMTQARAKHPSNYQPAS